MDDYITGVEQVGVDPTAAVETAAPVDNQEKVDPGTDVYEFKEYDLKEYDNKEFVEKPYEYGDYGDYGPTDAKPTSATYEDEFGPGVPAETDIRESSVSAGAVSSDGGRGEVWRWWSGMWKDGRDVGGICLVSCLRCPFVCCFEWYQVIARSALHAHSPNTNTPASTNTHLVYLSLLQINRCRPICQYRHALNNLLTLVTFAVYQRHPPTWLSHQWSVWII